MPRYIIYAIFGINHTLRRRNQGVLESFFIIRHKNDIVYKIYRRGERTRDIMRLGKRTPRKRFAAANGGA